MAKRRHGTHSSTATLSAMVTDPLPSQRTGHTSIPEPEKTPTSAKSAGPTTISHGRAKCRQRYDPQRSAGCLPSARQPVCCMCSLDARKKEGTTIRADCGPSPTQIESVAAFANLASCQRHGARETAVFPVRGQAAEEPGIRRRVHLAQFA